MNHKQIFLDSVLVLDTETTNKIPEQCEVVELASVTSVFKPEGVLFGAENGIPFAASAKNNISNKMISGKPLFKESLPTVYKMLHMDDSSIEYFVAHNCSYDQRALSTAFLEAGDFDLAKSTLDKNHKSKKWICTYRLAQHLFGHDFPDIQYNQNYLRYMLDLDVPDSINPHRATDDVIVCFKLLDAIVDYAALKGDLDMSKAVGPQLHSMCWKMVNHTNFPFGKHKGKPLSSIPTDYYLYAIDKFPALDSKSYEYDHDLAESVLAELTKRL
jgi:DNA polymerase III epsilon subunit-like protein